MPFACSRGAPWITVPEHDYTSQYLSDVHIIYISPSILHTQNKLVRFPHSRDYHMEIQRKPMYARGPAIPKLAPFFLSTTTRLRQKAALVLMGVSLSSHRVENKYSGATPSTAASLHQPIPPSAYRMAAHKHPPADSNTSHTNPP